MLRIPRPGQWVSHPVYGRGEVARYLRGGRYLLVRFEGRRLLVQVRPHEVAPARGPHRGDPLVPAPPPADRPPPMEPALLPSGEKGDLLALQVLEALRCGVVPAHLVELYTVGREEEMSRIAADLGRAEKTGAARVILGDYGSGKTHLLELIEHRALERNFLVSRLTLDGGEVAPSHPKRVYRALVRHLIYPDQPGFPGLEPLFEAAAQKLPRSWFDRRSSAYHHYLSPALAYFRELRRGEALRERLLDWIEGHPTLSNVELDGVLRRATGLRGYRLYALMDHRTLAHLYAYLVGGLAVMAREVGYRGLVVLFDEAEFYGLLSRSSREFADLLFGYYAGAALGPGRVRFDVYGSFRGGQAVHRSFPPLYREVQNLYCVFAMTEDPEGLAFLSAILDPSHFIRLNSLALEHYQELCRRVIELYRRCYPDFTAARQVEKPLGEVVYSGVERGAFDTPRQVLKFVLDLLDFSRLCRERVADYVREIRACLQ